MVIKFWKVLIWNMVITINAKCLRLLRDGKGNFHYDFEKYLCNLAPDKLTI